MSDIIEMVSTVSDGLSITCKDIRVRPAGSSLTKGQICYIGSNLEGSTVSAATPANALQRRTGIIGVALSDIPVNTYGFVRISGPCLAKVKSTAGGTLAVDARLGVGTAGAFDMDASAVDANRYQAYSADTGTMVATVAQLKNIVLMGPNGLGIAGGVA